MEEIRCPGCRRMLAEGRVEELRIKCPRCKTFTHLKAPSPHPERHGASRKDRIHGDSPQE